MGIHQQEPNKRRETFQYHPPCSGQKSGGDTPIADKSARVLREAVLKTDVQGRSQHTSNSRVNGRSCLKNGRNIWVTRSTVRLLSQTVR